MTLRVVSVKMILSALPVLALVGCEASKSSTPTSPSVAGPIAGVTISAPVLLEPTQGIKLKESQQPIKLVAQTATTTGVRPLTYTFEVSTDASFGVKVYSRAGVVAIDNKASVVIDRLEIGRSYYWRAWAEDGANTGTKSTTTFEIYPKAVVNPPVPTSPINDVVTDSVTPVLTVSNAVTSGPVGQLTYEFQLATDQAFSKMVATGTSGEGPGQTIFGAPALANNTPHYWRARATDSETTSAWTITQAFRTPPAKVPDPGNPGNPGNPNTGNCDSLVNDKPALVNCIHAAVRPAAGSVDQAFEVTKRVAWALRGEGAGLLRKDGGENIVSWQGMSFSAGRICYPDGHIYKVLGDVGGANTPSWSDNGFVDRSLYVPAIDPSKR